MKTAIVSVINDLVSDQRVDRQCNVLVDEGYSVLLVGRNLRGSLPLGLRRYNTHRMRLLFEKGPLFYMEFNLRLFLFLLFKKSSLIVSNDLDTLMSCSLVASLKRKKLLFDSHEYFTEVPELVSRPKVQKIWKSIEKKYVSKLKRMITVNESIADLFRKEYKVDVEVIRNMPPLHSKLEVERSELNLPSDVKIILLQGAGINVDRGAEEMVQAMQYINDALFVVVGSGDVIDQLKQMVVDLNLKEKVKFIGKVPFQELRKYTAVADIGVSLDKPTNINYQFSLPNKLFDYMHSGLALFVSDLVEVSRIVNEYEVGVVFQEHDPKLIAEKMNDLIKNETQLDEYKNNSVKASEALNWDSEKENLINILHKIENE